MPRDRLYFKVAAAWLSLYLYLAPANGNPPENALKSIEQKNFEAGLPVLRALAETGDPIAQSKLAELYYTGSGVKESKSEAAKWYRRAAEQQNTRAQRILAMMYAQGQGVLKDLEEAARWYQIAANQGDDDARYSLGMMYLNGEGVLQDCPTSAPVRQI